MNYNILAVIFLIAIYLFERKIGLKKKEAMSFVLWIGWSYYFFTLGSPLITTFWSSANGASFFVLFMLVFWGGSALAASLPYISEKNWSRVWKITKFFIAFSLIYIAIDDITLGPPAVGPSSPYIGKNICALDPTTYAEDVFAGCYLVQNTLHIDPFSQAASFWVYAVFPVALLFIAVYLLGIKKAEDLLKKEGL